MKLNKRVDEKVIVTVRQKEYPVTISGTGIPILSIGIGQLNERTLSDRFRQQFKIYSSNLYWVKENSLDVYTDMTMATVVDDIAQLAAQLHLSKYFIFAHSAYGIVALECAKKYPNSVLGIIMYGTPVNCNPEVAATNDAYFQKNADEHRKKIDAMRRAQIAQEDLTKLSASERFLREYCYRDAARYWHNPEFNCADLWQGIVLADIIDYFFATLLPAIDVTQDLEKVTCPVFLAAGKSDYDCCPFLWKNVKNLPAKMEISEFEHSGHWPTYEEQDLFDERIAAWLAKNKLSFK